jgi:hypothetical protein
MNFSQVAKNFLIFFWNFLEVQKIGVPEIFRISVFSGISGVFMNM